MKTTDYRPIGCDLHSELELLALRRTRVVAHANDPVAGPVRWSGEVCDVRTRDGAEYLVLLNVAGEHRDVRLDRLSALFAPDGAPLWRQESDS